jgi:hypothetical protein
MLTRCAPSHEVALGAVNLSARCLDSRTKSLKLPLRWGDPPARQVPLFIWWEQWSNFLPLRIEDVVFIQIGANCGKNTYGCAVGGDPIWSYATSCGWHGVAVEPVTYVFKALVPIPAGLEPVSFPARAYPVCSPAAHTFCL